MNYRGAILQEQDYSSGVQAATFKNIRDAYAYFDDLLPEYPPTQAPTIVISNETYQHVLDNEDNLKRCISHLQQLYEPYGYLNQMDIAELISIIMQSIHVDEIVNLSQEGDAVDDEMVDAKE